MSGTNEDEARAIRHRYGQIYRVSLDRIQDMPVEALRRSVTIFDAWREHYVTTGFAADEAQAQALRHRYALICDVPLGSVRDEPIDEIARFLVAYDAQRAMYLSMGFEVDDPESDAATAGGPTGTATTITAP